MKRSIGYIVIGLLVLVILYLGFERFTVTVTGPDSTSPPQVKQSFPQVSQAFPPYQFGPEPPPLNAEPLPSPGPEPMPVDALPPLPKLDPTLVKPTSSDSKALYDARMNLATVEQRFKDGSATEEDINGAKGEVERLL